MNSTELVDEINGHVLHALSRDHCERAVLNKDVFNRLSEHCETGGVVLLDNLPVPRKSIEYGLLRQKTIFIATCIQ